MSPQARDLAKTVTSREGETMGDWLSDVIRRVGAAQAAGRPLGPPHRRGLPVLPGRRPVRDPAPEQSARAVEAESEPDLVDEAALAALVAERIERTETRLVGLLGSLEDIVTRLTGRLERLEREIEDPGDPDDRGSDRRSLPRS